MFEQNFKFHESSSISIHFLKKLDFIYGVMTQLRSIKVDIAFITGNDRFMLWFNRNLFFFYYILKFQVNWLND